MFGYVIIAVLYDSMQHLFFKIYMKPMDVNFKGEMIVGPVHTGYEKKALRLITSLLSLLVTIFSVFHHHQ